MSLDLLAWDFFLGLSLVFAAGVFSGKATLRPRTGLAAAGLLCLAGTLGPASGNLRVQYLGIAGYAFLFLLPVLFCQGSFDESNPVLFWAVSYFESAFPGSDTFSIT